MSTHQWRGLLTEYAERLGITKDHPVITLGEGGTPLVRAEGLSKITSCDVYLKVEGCNPTGSFKDRGMTMAISRAVKKGAQAVICASTGNTSASAAAYAAVAGLPCAVLIPAGKIAIGKLAQAVAHNAHVLQVDGNFDDCLKIAQELSRSYQVTLVNSTNPQRIIGQQTAAWEIVDALGRVPDVHCLPVGNAGNISAYWSGYTADVVTGRIPQGPRMWGFQAEGAAPFVQGVPVPEPETIATAIRIGNPASWKSARNVVRRSLGNFEAVSDKAILAAHRHLSAKEGVFVEPASAAAVAGLLAKHDSGQLPAGKLVVATVTGHGLKDPYWATHDLTGETFSATTVPADVVKVADALRLQPL